MKYCKALYLCCTLILRFSNVEISPHFNLAGFPSVLLVFTRPLMGKLNFRGYLISRFYPTREIRENLMHAKKYVFYSKLAILLLFLVLQCLHIMQVIQKHTAHD